MPASSPRQSRSEIGDDNRPGRRSGRPHGRFREPSHEPGRCFYYRALFFFLVVFLVPAPLPGAVILLAADKRAPVAAKPATVAMVVASVIAGPAVAVVIESHLVAYVVPLVDWDGSATPSTIEPTKTSVLPLVPQTKYSPGLAAVPLSVSAKLVPPAVVLGLELEIFLALSGASLSPVHAPILYPASGPLS